MTRSVEGGVRVKNGFHVKGIHQSVSGETSCGHSPEEGLLPRLSEADFMRKVKGFKLALRLIIIDK
jgi:hypothetical protein